LSSSITGRRVISPRRAARVDLPAPPGPTTITRFLHAYGANLARSLSQGHRPTVTNGPTAVQGQGRARAHHGEQTRASAHLRKYLPFWPATWNAKVTVVPAPEQLLAAQPRAGEARLVRPACAWPARPASPLPCALTPPPRPPAAQRHTVLTRSARHPGPARAPAVTGG
jgi:hypothetical protein